MNWRSPNKKKPPERNPYPQKKPVSRLFVKITFHRHKLKQAQDALDKLCTTKKQDKLLSTVTQDAAHDLGPTDHQHNSMWDYLKQIQT